MLDSIVETWAPVNIAKKDATDLIITNEMFRMRIKGVPVFLTRCVPSLERHDPILPVELAG